MGLSIHSPEHFMKEALKQAQLAYEAGEVPIGAVVVYNNQIVARAHNQVEQLNDPTAHAEMIAITSACNTLNSKYLQDCDLYVTLEPCSMCASALGWSQVSNIYYAASDPKKGYAQISNKMLHPGTKVHTGLMQTEASELLLKFFKNLRK